MIRKLLTLTLLLIFCILAHPQNTQAQTSKATVKDYIVKHSLEMGIDPALGLSIAKMESGFVHEKRSSFGAVGVFQLMPSTARRMGYNPYYLSDSEYYSQKANPDPAIMKYKNGGASVSANSLNKVLQADRENNVIKRVGYDPSDLPFVSLSGAI